MTFPRRSEDDFARDMAARRGPTLADELSGTTHVADDPIVRDGIEAATRLGAGHHWSDWIAVGRAVEVGRAEAMRQAHTNAPKGRLYADALHRWLLRTGLIKVIGDKGARTRLLELIEHLPKVAAWRNTLPANKRLELNHPNSVWRSWKKSTVVPDPNKPTRTSPVAELKEALAESQQELARVKAAGDGNLFTRATSARDMVRLLRSVFPESKLAEIRRLLAEEGTS